MNARTLGALTELVRTWNPSKSPGEAFAYIDLGAVDNDVKLIRLVTTITVAEAPSRARQLVASGDVLVSTVRPNLNAVAVVPDCLDGATASTGFTVLRPGPQLDGRYLFHWVRSPAFVADMVLKATGASYPAVSDRIVKTSDIPAPPLEEQRRVAAMLDHADAIRAKRRHVVAHIDTLSQAIFNDMFGDPTVNRAAMQVAPLREWIDPARPVTYGILKPGPDIQGGIPYVRVADMQDRGIRLSTVRRTTRAIAHEYRRSSLRGGDLLMSIRGHVGRFASVPPELHGANITQDSARLAVTDPDSAIYLRAAMESQPLQRWMAWRTKGAAVQGINLGDLRELPVPVPALRDVTKFAETVRTVEQERAAARTSLHLVDELFTSLQSRAFRGEL